MTAGRAAMRDTRGQPSMFAAVAAFELRHQLRQPLFWAVTGIFFLLTFGFMASERVHIGDTANVHKNGPFSIVQTHLLMALFFMFASAAFVAGAVLRDDETGFGPIIRATRLTKFDYLYGRFVGAFGAAALAFLAVSLGMAVGALAPWIDSEQLGSFRPDAYLFAYAVMALPVILFSSALFFTVATVTRSMAWTFVAVIVLVVAYTLGGIALGKPDLEPLLARWDPFGLFTFDVVTRYWTANDRNTLVPRLAGVLLWNRGFVLLLSGASLALALPLFDRRAAFGSATRREPTRSAPARRRPLPVPRRQPRFDRRVGWAQLVGRTRFDMGQIFRGPVFWILLGLGLANATAGLWESTDDTGYGGALLPVTRSLIPVLEGSFYFFTVIIAAYYAGELVWRDHDRRVHEMIDATPAPDWTFILPKTLGVSLVLIAAVLVSIVAAVIVQVAKGYYDFEFDKYLLWYALPNAVDLVIMAILAVFMQVLAPNKFVGWGLMVLYIIALFALPGLGVEHNLLVFGERNPAPLSDMNRMGRFWIGAWWFRLYWAAFCALFLVVGHGLWRRGGETRYAARLKALPGRLRGPAGWIAIAAITVFVGAGGYIYLNTNIWNPYRTGDGDDRWLADYERALLPYERLPQPGVTAVKLVIEISPRIPLMETKGLYWLENKTSQPIHEVHVRFDRRLDVRALSVQGGWAKKSYDRFNYRIFAFDEPMAPGARRWLSFETRLTQHGFRNAQRKTRDLTTVVDNGTFVNSFEFAPQIGMTRDQLLTDRAKRRRFGLPTALHPPLLGDAPSRAFSYAAHVGWTTADITISTDADQLPIAPGERVSDITTGNRRTAHFVSSTPILQFFSIQSARYAQAHSLYKGVDLAVYFDPQHGANVPRMIRALKASLDYYQANFSPYQFHQARIVEFPDYARFAQSFAGTFPWSEGLGFIADYRDPARIDLVTYIAAHEFAHQWWAHQLIGADQQGATTLTETLAQYSALRVMRSLYGPDKIRKFLKYELDSYLRARGGEAAAEQPLETVEDQGYIHYRKGSLVMDRLANEIGEAAINRALRGLLARYAFKGAPYPTSLALVAALRAEAPADKQTLITDLFEKITLYALQSRHAEARLRADGRWDVSLTLEAQKFHADGAGREVTTPMNEVLEVGLFAASPDAADFGPAQVIAFERRAIRSGSQTLHFITDRRPKLAGVDPYDELIDRNSTDNTIPVS